MTEREIERAREEKIIKQRHHMTSRFSDKQNLQIDVIDDRRGDRCINTHC